MIVRLTNLIALLVALLVAGCRTMPTRSLDVACPPGTADFALDPYPTPRQASLTNRVVSFDPTRIEFVSLKDRAGVFSVEVSKGGRIRIGSTNAASRGWALLTLEQMTSDGYVRIGTVRDRPGFPLRGSKRLKEWELSYRANLAYEKPFSGVVNVAVHSPGGTLDATESGVERAVAAFRNGYRRGARRFAIEFDDVAFHLTDESRERFGTYPQAMAAYLAACRKRLMELDPAAVLYWLPQTYWTSEPRLTVYAGDLGRAGGLPDDLGLVLTGPDVISDTIRATDIDGARKAFGLTKTKALIYDNRGREGDHGPLEGRGGDLLKVADAVFGERGEVLNRLTRLDYAWNPGAYDPERSHLLACREIVGPAAARPLSQLIREAARLTPGKRRILYEQVRREFRPPARSPVDARACLDRIWRDIEAVPKP